MVGCAGDPMGHQNTSENIGWTDKPTGLGRDDRVSTKVHVDDARYGVEATGSR